MKIPQLSFKTMKIFHLILECFKLAHGQNAHFFTILLAIWILSYNVNKYPHLMSDTSIKKRKKRTQVKNWYLKIK